MAIVDKINAITGEHGNTIEEALKYIQPGGGSGYNVTTIKKYYAEEQTVTFDENGRVSLDVGDRHMSDFSNYKTGIVNINGVEFTGRMNYYGGSYLSDFPEPDSVLIDGVEAFPAAVGDANYSEHIFDARDVNEYSGAPLAGKTCTVSVYFVDKEVTVTEDFKKAARESTKVYKKVYTCYADSTTTHSTNGAFTPNLKYEDQETGEYVDPYIMDFDDIRVLSVGVPSSVVGKMQISSFGVSNREFSIEFYMSNAPITIYENMSFATIEFIKYFEPFAEPESDNP